MARPRSETPKSVQLNIRLDEEQADALATIDYLYGITSPELVRQLLAAEIVKRRREPLFSEAMKLRTAARLQAEGRLLAIPQADGAS